MDEQCGGGTDAKSLFGSDGTVGSSTLLEPKPDVQYTLRHYIDGGVEG